MECGFGLKELTHCKKYSGIKTDSNFVSRIIEGHVKAHVKQTCNIVSLVNRRDNAFGERCSIDGVPRYEAAVEILKE